MKRMTILIMVIVLFLTSINSALCQQIEDKYQTMAKHIQPLFLKAEFASLFSEEQIAQIEKCVGMINYRVLRALLWNDLKELYPNDSDYSLLVQQYKQMSSEVLADSNQDNEITHDIVSTPQRFIVSKDKANEESLESFSYEWFDFVDKYFCSVNTTNVNSKPIEIKYARVTNSKGFEYLSDTSISFTNCSDLAIKRISFGVYCYNSINERCGDDYVSSIGPYEKGQTVNLVCSDMWKTSSKPTTVIVKSVSITYMDDSKVYISGDAQIAKLYNGKAPIDPSAPNDVLKPIILKSVELTNTDDKNGKSLSVEFICQSKYQIHDILFSYYIITINGERKPGGAFRVRGPFKNDTISNGSSIGVLKDDEACFIEISRVGITYDSGSALISGYELEFIGLESVLDLFD